MTQSVVLEELDSRKLKLSERLTQLKTESEEIWKSMETAEKSLSEMVGASDYDTTRFFVEEDRSLLRSDGSDAVSIKQKADRKETEEFYLNVSDETKLKESLKKP